jgi:hypothetical protein
MPKKIINLDSLLKSEGSVIVDGEEVRVLHIDGESYDLIASIQDVGNVVPMYKAAARCVPGLPEERVMRMSIEQINAIIEVASGTVKDVEALASPNSEPAGVRKKQKV